MMRIPFSSFSLSTYVLLAFSYLFCLSAQASQMAVVDSLRAVIYADLDRESPIGYVRKGKQLMVGNVKRRNGTMLPVMVNGQVAWIKVVDVYLPQENRSFDDPRSITEHEVLIDEEVKDPLDQNNFLTMKLSPSTLTITGDLENADGTKEDLSEELDSATEIDFLYEHKNPYHAIHWGVGLSYLSAKVDQLTMKSVMVKGGIAWVPLRTSFINLEVYSNLTLTGDFRIISEGIGEYKGNMFGLDYGAALRFFPESKFGLFLGAGGSLYKFSNLSTVVLPGETQSVDFSSLIGSKVEVGVVYKF